MNLYPDRRTTTAGRRGLTVWSIEPEGQSNLDPDAVHMTGVKECSTAF